jgi:hypothetical protein
LKKTVHNFKKCMPFKKLFIISIFGSWFSKNVSLYFLKLFKIFKKLFINFKNCSRFPKKGSRFLKNCSSILFLVHDIQIMFLI